MVSKSFLTALFSTTLLATPLAAQNGIPWCERAGASSVQAAYALIDQGDAILNQLSDCSQINLMACEQALGLYKDAEQQIAQVFFDAKGEACTYCDISAIGDVASALAIRGDQFTQALQWGADLRSVWNDFQNWKGAPYCTAAANAPTAPIGCAFVNETPGAYLPDARGTELQNVSAEDCRAECDATDWCRSFTINRGARACQLHSQTAAEVPLQNAFNDQISQFTCVSGAQSGPGTLAPPPSGACTSVDSYAGARLNSGFGWVLDNMTLPDCVTACENEATCTGYDYNTSAAQCVIRSETMAQDGLETIAGWTHFECN